MKKNRYVIAVILLGIFVIFAVSHVIKREEIPSDLALFISSAEGVSENIAYVIDGPEEEQIDLAMSGTVNYYNRLIRYAERLTSLCEDEEEKMGLMALQQKLEQNYEDVSFIAEKYKSEGQITAEEMELLKAARESIDSLLSDMYQRYGRITK